MTIFRLYRKFSARNLSKTYNWILSHQISVFKFSLMVLVKIGLIRSLFFSVNRAHFQRVETSIINIGLFFGSLFYRFLKETKFLYNQMKVYCTDFNFCRHEKGLKKRKYRFKKKDTFTRILNYKKINGHK